MEDIPSISSGSVGSRFVSQEELETAKARRDEQWKAAYARLGQEPPPAPEEETKQEEWEERNKLGNQFRALEEDEVLFLDSVLEKQREEERLREEMDGKELKNFRQAVAARENAAKPPPVNITPSSLNSAPPVKSVKSASTTTAPSVKKDTKKSLKGVIVKKKSKSAPAPSAKPKSDEGESRQPQTASKDTKDKDDADEPPKAKRRKISESSPS